MIKAARRHWKPYTIDPSYVLSWPLHKYGTEQTEIWDQSGNNNNGTITNVVPATYPMLSPANLQINGNMETNDYWEAMGTPTTCAQSGGQVHSGFVSWKAVVDAASEGIQTKANGRFALTAGKTYKMYAHIYGDAANNFILDLYGPNKAGAYTLCESETFGETWTYREAILNCTDDETAAYFRFYSAGAAGTFYVDNVCIQEVIGREALGWDFDGGTSYIVAPDSTSVNMGGLDFTIMFWARTKGQLGSRFVSKRDATLPLNLGYEVIYYGVPPSKLGIFLGDLPHGTTTGPLSIGQTIYPNKWQHIAVTFDRDGNATGYVDGVAGNLPRDISGFAGTVTNTVDLCIGKYASADQQFYYGGLDDLNIIRRLLSVQEIRNHRELTRHIYGI